MHASSARRATPSARCRGGERGEREASWEADRSIEMKIVCEAAVAQSLAQHVLSNYAPHFQVAMFTADVGVFRARSSDAAGMRRCGSEDPAATSRPAAGWPGLNRALRRFSIQAI